MYIHICKYILLRFCPKAHLFSLLMKKAFALLYQIMSMVLWSYYYEVVSFPVVSTQAASHVY